MKIIHNGCRDVTLPSHPDKQAWKEPYAYGHISPTADSTPGVYGRGATLTYR
jgi:hypothetical protein